MKKCLSFELLQKNYYQFQFRHVLTDWDSDPLHHADPITTFECHHRDCAFLLRIIETMSQKLFKETELNVFASRIVKRFLQYGKRFVCLRYLRDATEVLKEQFTEACNEKRFTAHLNGKLSCILWTLKLVPRNVQRSRDTSNAAKIYLFYEKLRSIVEWCLPLDFFKKLVINDKSHCPLEHCSFIQSLWPFWILLKIVDEGSFLAGELKLRA